MVETTELPCPKNIRLMGQKRQYFITQMGGSLAMEDNLSAIKTLIDEDKVEYVIAGEEIAPTTGTVHMHLVLSFKKKQRATALWKVLKGANIELLKGPIDKAAAYCVKDGKTVMEHGTLKLPSPGKRSDIDAFKEAVEAGDIQTFRDAMQKHTKLCAANMTFVQRYLDMFAKKTPFDVSTFQLRIWQDWLLEKLKAPPVDREIIVIQDDAGNSGKSTMASMIPVLTEKRTQTLHPGNRRDTAHAIKEDSEIIIFDIARSRGDCFQMYDVLENIKDGRLQSDKYDSRMKEFHPCHVVVFTNHPVDKTQLSQDRWCIYTVGPEDVLPTNPTSPSTFGKAFSSDVTGDGPVTYQPSKGINIPDQNVNDVLMPPNWRALHAEYSKQQKMRRFTNGMSARGLAELLDALKKKQIEDNPTLPSSPKGDNRMTFTERQVYGNMSKLP